MWYTVGNVETSTIFTSLKKDRLAFGVERWCLFLATRVSIDECVYLKLSQLLTKRSSNDSTY